MSLKCDRCSEKIKSPDSGDHYSKVWAFLKMKRCLELLRLL